MKSNINAIDNRENPQNLILTPNSHRTGKPLQNYKLIFFFSEECFSLVVMIVFFQGNISAHCTYELVLCYNCHRKEINSILMRSFVTDKLSSSKSVRAS